MTEQGSAGPPARRTRRQLLAGKTGALAAVLTAEALADPAPASAGTDGDVVLGADNDESTTTSITNTTPGGIALACYSTGGGTESVRGLSLSGDGVGVTGYSANG